MSKLQVGKIFRFNHNANFCLAQNFANDASKTGEEYAKEGLKQGQKLGEQAFEVGKDKGNIYDFLNVMISMLSYS